MFNLNKLQLSGIAIIMVILTHTGINIFYPGFMGVDIFFFLSGFYLCNSYKKHSLAEFYNRRFKRIIPMFLFLAIAMSIKFYYTNEKITIWDFIGNITTVSYYIPSSNFVDWYLSSLFAFYLLYPLFYKLMSNKWNLYILCILQISVFAIFALFDLHWRYECALGRIPVFCMGIIAYHYMRCEDKVNKPFIFATISCLMVIPAIALYKGGSNVINTYYLVYLVAPICIYLLILIMSKVKFHSCIKKLLDFCGKYSLELYVANILSLNFIFFGQRALSTIMLTIILGSICIVYNKQANKLIDKLS